ncbi:hypothetical protein N7516_006283 [Penicillium verrucosum]|uniref:uncharacterized protein n=1 Tax=Penicillium verrucosum TaxID=60171 RepID=UPI0025458727|nr:uncharacterized protein N7516_006283 [Penicillium verrucosum]KAJ5931794.1 hypothetical protein N7516_006283 [Penicillium verrucosum]
MQHTSSPRQGVNLHLMNNLFLRNQTLQQLKSLLVGLSIPIPKRRHNQPPVNEAEVNGRLLSSKVSLDAGQIWLNNIMNLKTSHTHQYIFPRPPNAPPPPSRVDDKQQQPRPHKPRPSINMHIGNIKPNPTN